MSTTNTTGWQFVQNGDTTQLDLTMASHVDSAKIRWRGSNTTTTSTDYSTNTNTNTGSGSATGTLETTYPSVPSGYDFYYHHYYGKATLTNDTTFDESYSVTFDWFQGSTTKTGSVGSQQTITVEHEENYISPNSVGETVKISTNYSDRELEVTAETEGKNTTTTTHNTENPSVTINGETISHSGTLSNNEETGWYSITALQPNTVNDISHSISGSGEADYELEYTYQPKLPAPTRNKPLNETEFETQNIEFELVLDDEPDNDSTTHHARVQISDIPDMSNIIYNYQSANDPSNWEYYDGSAWQSFPSGGVSPGTKVRITSDDLDYKRYYWKTTQQGDWDYGYQSSKWRYNVVLSTAGLYALTIEGTEYDAYSLTAAETSNGEIGSINFTLNNEGNTANSTINYNDDVILAVNDSLGNTEQFKARVKEKNPSGNTLQVQAVTGGGILSERIIDKDYSSQDIGLIAKDIIDNYCSPLTSNNIDTSTGITAPIEATDKKPLKVFEELRRQHGIYYYVDKDWDVHFYVDSAISDGLVRIRRGD